jgi:hypothetical protein
MNKMTFVEDRDRRRTSPHVDERDTEIALVGNQRTQAGGMTGHHSLGDLEVRAAHADLEIAHRTACRGNEVDVDAETFAEHAPRVVDRGAIDRVADRGRMDDVAIRRLRRQLDELLHPAHVAFADLVMADGDFERLFLRRGRATAHADDHLAHMLPAHFLRGGNRRGDGSCRRLHVDDVAGAHSLRGLMADTHDPQALSIDARHEAHDFVGSDIQRRYDAISCLGHGVPRLLTLTLGEVSSVIRQVRTLNRPDVF